MPNIVASEGLRATERRPQPLTESSPMRASDVILEHFCDTKGGGKGKKEESEQPVESKGKKQDENNRSFRKKKNNQVFQSAAPPSITVFSIANPRGDSQSASFDVAKQQQQQHLSESHSSNMPHNSVMIKFQAEPQQQQSQALSKITIANDNKATGSKVETLSHQSPNVDNVEKKPLPTVNEEKVEEESTPLMASKHQPLSGKLSAEDRGEECEALHPPLLHSSSDSDGGCPPTQVPLTVFPQYWSRREKMRNAPCLAHEFWGHLCVKFTPLCI